MRRAIGIARALEELVELGLLLLQARSGQCLLVDHHGGGRRAVAEEGGAEQLRRLRPAERFRRIGDHIDADRAFAETSNMEHALGGQHALAVGAVVDLVEQRAGENRVAIVVGHVVQRAAAGDPVGMDRPHRERPAELVRLDLGIAVALAQRPMRQRLAELERRPFRADPLPDQPVDRMGALDLGAGIRLAHHAPWQHRDRLRQVTETGPHRRNLHCRIGRDQDARSRAQPLRDPVLHHMLRLARQPLGDNQQSGSSHVTDAIEHQKSSSSAVANRLSYFSRISCHRGCRVSARICMSTSSACGDTTPAFASASAI